ncbi:DNA primase [Neisseria sp. oral taxon 020 str. F0370]|uniref:DNA primase n=1 Tax=unclassified Neisseria TaxID=2623750 RepID=UPI0002A3C5F3|nr:MULTISPECIES: DNA primase [unclassified Neisseria]ASP18170.1 DNA primase [Neisseria sp. KEM232]EKY08216.1 DNA primase [Neisseria sp. oral taxon 020 str. F0370]
MIPSDFIDELLAKIDIVDIIDEQVPLKKGGANYMACCPFHKEKTPSFSVSPSKQFYHCFSCGAHGSAIGFIMEHQGLSFPEAVQYLADRAGMVVPRVRGQNDNPEIRAERKKKQQTLEETTAAAADFYAQQLKLYPAAQQYLDTRGLSAEITARYGLGYAPDGWTPLSQVFQPYPNSPLVESGMVIHNEEQGRHYDRFRHRVMFPIRDARGQVIGFGGRVLDDSKPKYLNSPDTPLFDKGKNLYGLYEGRAAVKEAGRILVVEGYMDVVALAQFGIGYGVAALGTATTAEHVKILMRQADSIYFCFDGDSAGRKAAWRALENALPQLKDGKSLHFLFLPEEHDPDSYIRAYGKAQFEDALVHQSKPLSEYFWHALSDGLNLSTQEGKAELVKTASPLLAQITAPALAFLLKQTLSELVGIDPANLAHLLGQEAPKRHVKAKSYKLPPPAMSGRPQILTLTQQLIRSLMANPAWVVHVRLPEYFVLDGDAACLANIADFIRSSPALPAHAQIWEHFRGSTGEQILRGIYRNGGADGDGAGEEDEAAFAEGMDKLAKAFKTAQIDTLKRKAAAEGLDAAEKQLLLKLLAER